MPIKLTTWDRLNFEGFEADDEADGSRRAREADEAGGSRDSEDVTSILVYSLVYGLDQRQARVEVIVGK
jgi:hypothetical protein